MKVNIDFQKREPLYTIYTGKNMYSHAVEVFEIPDAKVREFRRVFIAFNKMQVYLEKLTKTDRDYL